MTWQRLAHNLMAGFYNLILCSHACPDLVQTGPKQIKGYEIFLLIVERSFQFYPITRDRRD